MGLRWFTSQREDRLVQIFLTVAACVSLFIIGLIFIFLGKEALPFAIHPGLLKLVDLSWNPTSFQMKHFGMIPLIAGTLVVTFMATLIAVPCGVLSSLYLSELTAAREREILKPFIEILAGIPSVVLGFFGLMVVAPFVKHVFHASSGLNAFTGAIVLAIMALPTIISLSEDAIRSVPLAYKQASLALGASPIQTLFKVTLPAALPGIMASVMLGVGRVVGETMAVMMVTGNSAVITFHPFESVRTMTATIAAEMGEVSHTSDHYHALFCIGIVLLLFTLAFNRTGQYFLRKYRMG